MVNGRYSILRYSSNAGATIEVEDVFAEGLKAVAGSAVFVEVSDSFDESAVCLGRVTASVITSAEAFGYLSYSATMVANIDTYDTYTSDVFASIKTAQDLYVTEVLSSSFESRAYMSTNIPTSEYWYSNLYAVSSIAKNLSDAGLFAADVLFATVYSGTIEEHTLSVEVVIPPGGELRIDSDKFTATLNGENVLHLQSGYWPTLSRKLVQMTTSSGSGGEMTGEVVFAERWL